MNTFTFSMALLMGLTGSLHCAGMCGAIIWIMPFNMMHGVRKWVAVGLYHLGRISVYAAMAVILYAFKGLFHPQIQQYISIALGAMLLLAGVISFIPGNKYAIKLPWAPSVKKKLGKVIGNPSLPALFTSGMLNGLLPCGLVYMALSASIAAHDSIHAAALMYVFGLGTMPMLVSITIFKSNIASHYTHNIRKLVPMVLFAFGGLFVVRGMNLGIPYLSPKVTVEQQVVKASCCHKK